MCWAAGMGTVPSHGTCPPCTSTFCPCGGFHSLGAPAGGTVSLAQEATCRGPSPAHPRHSCRATGAHASTWTALLGEEPPMQPCAVSAPQSIPGVLPPRFASPSPHRSWVKGSRGTLRAVGESGTGQDRAAEESPESSREAGKGGKGKGSRSPSSPLLLRTVCCIFPRPAKPSSSSPSTQTSGEEGRRCCRPGGVGLLVDGVHGALHGAQQRLGLVRCLLQQEAGHELVHIAAALIHLPRQTGSAVRPCTDHPAPAGTRLGQHPSNIPPASSSPLCPRL